MTVLRVGRTPVRRRSRRHLQVVPTAAAETRTAVVAPAATAVVTVLERCPGAALETPCDFRLRFVEYDDGGEVRRFECDACGRVTYR
ncbi:MAG: hypothetical protein ACJ72E_12215 [Marmoricola sp.]